MLVRLLEADPYELEALTALGRALLEDGRTAQALEAFERVLRFDPDHAGGALLPGRRARAAATVRSGRAGLGAGRPARSRPAPTPSQARTPRALRARPPAHLRRLGGLDRGARGPLKDLHIQDVFQLLDLGRKSGVLRVTSELRQTAGTVCFDRGGVVAAAVGSDPQPLGARLVRTGQDHRRRPRSRARHAERAATAAASATSWWALGSISRRELDRQLKAQIEEAVFELLRWSEGYFRFEEGAPCHAAVEAPVRFPTEALLMEAARRIDEWSRIGSKVSHLRLVPRLPAPEAQGSEPLDLVPFEWEVLAAVDGARDLHSLAEVLGRSEFEVARTVYGLTNAGIVVLDDPAQPGQESGAGTRSRGAAGARARGAGQGEYELAAGALEELLRIDPLMPEARRLLGLCYARSAVSPLRSTPGLRGVGWAPAHRARRRRARRRAAAPVGGHHHEGAGSVP